MAANIQGIVILRDGQIVREQYAAPYKKGDLRALYSLTKSFASAAFGFAEADGLIRRDDRVFDLLDAVPPGPNAQAMRVRHLLTMTAGYAQEDISYLNAPGWLEACLAREPDCAPGTTFVYDNRAPYYLSRIIERKTGVTLSTFLKKKLFDSLGITNFEWTTDPDGHNPGGFGLSMRLIDVARFGWMLCDKENERLSRSFVQDATRVQCPLPESLASAHRWSSGYGYWFWIAKDPGVYVGSGSFGQLLIVRPARREVTAVFAACAQPNVVYEACANDQPPLSDHIPPPGRAQKTPLRHYAFESNALKLRGLSIQGQGEQTLIALETERDRLTLYAGAHSFVENTLDVAPQGAGYPCYGDLYRRARVAGAWIGTSFHCRIVYVQTPYVDFVQAAFSSNGIRLRIERTPGFERLRTMNYDLIGREVDDA